MKKAARAIGIALLAASIGMGASACTASDPQGVRPSETATAVTTAPTTKADVSEAKKTLDAFFAAISSDTAKFKEERKKVDPAAPAPTAEDQVRIIREAYKDSFSYIDLSSMGNSKAMELIGGPAQRMDVYPDVSITALEDGFMIEGNNATFDGEHLKIKIGEAEDVTGADYSPGSIALSRVSGKWIITDFIPNESGEASSTAAPSE